MSFSRTAPSELSFDDKPMKRGKKKKFTQLIGQTLWVCKYLWVCIRRTLWVCVRRTLSAQSLQWLISLAQRGFCCSAGDEGPKSRSQQDRLLGIFPMTGKDRGLGVQHCHKQAENSDPKPESHVPLVFLLTCASGCVPGERDLGKSPCQGGHSMAGGLITGSSFRGILPCLWSFLGTSVLYKPKGREPNCAPLLAKQNLQGKKMRVVV